MSFRYAYNQLVYYEAGEDVASSIERVARFGYDAIELAGEPDLIDATEVRGRTTSAGISVSSVCSLYTAERDLAHPDNTVRRNAVEYVKRVADFAAEVGAPTIVIAPTACMKLRPLASPADEHRWAIDGIRAGGEYAASVGVDLTLECWNRYETYWLNTLEQGVAMWREAGLSNGGVMADAFHMNIEEASIADAIRETGPLINHVHLADSNRASPGTGHIDFKPILEALVDIGYKGYISFELLPATADPIESIPAPDQEKFFDPYTEQAITYMRALEHDLRALGEVAR